MHPPGMWHTPLPALLCPAQTAGQWSQHGPVTASPQALVLPGASSSEIRAVSLRSQHKCQALGTPETEALRRKKKTAASPVTPCKEVALHVTKCPPLAKEQRWFHCSPQLLPPRGKNPLPHRRRGMWRKCFGICEAPWEVHDQQQELSTHCKEKQAPGWPRSSMSPLTSPLPSAQPNLQSFSLLL